MLDFLTELWSNKLLMSSVIAWAAAQLIKTALYGILFREFKAERMWGSGGMPSSHAATVCCLTTSAIVHYGVGSPIFALSLILAAVVLHDARGVRYETGKQAKLITTITEFIEKTEQNPDIFPEVELKELVGHTPLQVAVGSVIGITIGLLVR